MHFEFPHQLDILKNMFLLDYFGFENLYNIFKYKKLSINDNVELLNWLYVYNKSDIINDLIKFRIAAINGDNPSLKTFIHFRAYLDSFSDNFPFFCNHVMAVSEYDLCSRNMVTIWYVSVILSSISDKEALLSNNKKFSNCLT
mgnify:CR=1 FL=1